MAKFPLLEQMRADRLANEAEIKAPIIDQLDRKNQIIKELNNDRKLLKEFNLHPIRTQINDVIANRFAHDLVAEVYEKVKGNLHAPVTITIDSQTLDLARPTSIQKQVLYEAVRTIDFTVFSYNDSILLKTVKYAEVHINRTFCYQIPLEND